MTRVHFHFGAADRQQAAADWIAAALLRGRRIAVVHPQRSELEAFDRKLWMQPATGFLPHCHADDPLAAETPVVLTTRLDAMAHDECVLNLDVNVPEGFARFAEIAEFVSTAEQDRALGRARYKFYRDRGYAIENVDLGGLT